MTLSASASLYIINLNVEISTWHWLVDTETLPSKKVKSSFSEYTKGLPWKVSEIEEYSLIFSVKTLVVQMHQMLKGSFIVFVIQRSFLSQLSVTSSWYSLMYFSCCHPNLFLLLLKTSESKFQCILNLPISDSSTVVLVHQIVLLCATVFKQIIS